MIRLSGAFEINEGFDAVWRADFDRAVAVLHNLDGPGCPTMRSRVFLRMGLAKRVVAEYEACRNVRLHPRERAEMTLIGSTAYRAIGDVARAHELDAEADRIAAELRDPLFDLACMTVATVRHFTAGRLAESKSIVERAMRLADAARNRETPYAYVFEINHLRARLLEISSMHAALAGDYREHERLLIEGILTSQLVRRHDIYTEVNLLANLATYLTTFSSARAREVILARVGSIVWNDHLDYKRTYIKRGLRCNKDIFGFSENIENFGGPGYPTLAWRVGASVDRLMNSNWADRAAFDSELHFATELAERIDWQATPGEEIASLPPLSALVAAHRPDVAEHLLEIYNRKLPTLPGQFLFTWEGRRPALEDFAIAAIAKARGEVDLARAKFAESLCYFRESNMSALAALTGIERFTLSQESADLAPAAAFLRAFPTSAFARRLGRAFERTARALPTDFVFLDQGVGAA